MKSSGPDVSFLVYFGDDFISFMGIDLIKLFMPTEVKLVIALFYKFIHFM